MPKYLVERSLPNITTDQLAAAAVRAKHTTAKMSQEGTPIRYLRSTFVPGEDKCFCLPLYDRACLRRGRASEL